MSELTPKTCPNGSVCAAYAVEQLVAAKRSPAKRRALRTVAQGSVFAGLLAAAQAGYVVLGGDPDPKVIAVTLAQAFGTGVLSYLHKIPDEVE